MDPEELVKLYCQNKDPRIREQIIIKFLPIVKYVIGRLRLNIKNKMELEDIHSAGIQGLIQALDDFDIKKKTKFKTYATWRVRGYILDYLRKIDIVSRSDRYKIKQIEQAIADLTKKYKREPTDLEISKYLNIDLTEYNRLLELTQINYVMSFDQRQQLNGDDVRLSDIIPDNSVEGPFEHSSRMDMIQVIKEAINNLPERLKLIVVMYYYDEMTLAEIGKVLCLSESRVSRLLGKAILQIRNDIKEIQEPRKLLVK